jgi:sugar phosphate isomerase/epimerase
LNSGNHLTGSCCFRLNLFYTCREKYGSLNEIQMKNKLLLFIRHGSCTIEAVILIVCLQLFVNIYSLRAQNESPGISVFSRNNIDAWCIVPFDSKKRGPVERAQMLGELGLIKMAYDWRKEHIPTFDLELETLKKNGIELTAFWLPTGQDPAHDSSISIILNLLKRHQVHTQLWCMVNQDENFDQKSQQEKIIYMAKPLRYLASEAAKIGCVVGLYNHGGWFGEPENELAIIEYLNLPNVGIVYNFHHAEKQVDRFPEFYPKILPHLLALNLAGLKREGADAKVVPIGQGDCELNMMRIVWKSSFHGPVGIINENTNPEAKTGLTMNLEGLKKVLEKMGDRKALATYE